MRRIIFRSVYENFDFRMPHEITPRICAGLERFQNPLRPGFGDFLKIVFCCDLFGTVFEICVVSCFCCAFLVVLCVFCSFLVCVVAFASWFYMCVHVF